MKMYLIYTEFKKLFSTGHETYLFDAKPELGFEFDIIYYEPTLKIKILNGNKLELTSDEIKKIEQYELELTKIVGHAVNNFGIQIRAAKLNDIEEGEQFIAAQPPCASSVWHSGKWHIAKAYLDGYSFVDNISESILIPLSVRKVWFETPPERPSSWHDWNDESGSWIESTTGLQAAKKVKQCEVITLFREMFEPINAIYPPEEQSSWLEQETEAQAYTAWLENGKKGEQPELTCLSAILMPGESLETLCESIMRKGLLFRTLRNLLQKQQRVHFNTIADLKTVAEVSGYRVEYLLPPDLAAYLGMSAEQV